MLQENHSTETNCRIRLQGYHTIVSTYKSNKAGVFLVFNNFNLQIQTLFSDPSGRFIIRDIKAKENAYPRLTIMLQMRMTKFFP